MPTLYEAVQDARDRAVSLDSAVLPVAALDNILRDHAPDNTLLTEDGVAPMDWEEILGDVHATLVITVAHSGEVAQYSRASAFDTIRLLTQAVHDNLKDMPPLDDPLDDRQKDLITVHLVELDEARDMMQGVLDGTYPRG